MTAEILPIHPTEPEPNLIARVVQSLAAGNVAALPTDTFYGLAVDPVNLHAVDRIYQIKTRQAQAALAAHLRSAQAYGLIRDTDTAFDRLAERFWPGPLTIIVRPAPAFPCASPPTPATSPCACRMPQFPAPSSRASACPSPPPPPTCAACPSVPTPHFVRAQLADQIPLIVDGGPTPRSLPTTIVDLSGGGNSWMILREGAVPTHEIALTLQH